jgi:hypothetical protein
MLYQWGLVILYTGVGGSNEDRAMLTWSERVDIIHLILSCYDEERSVSGRMDDSCGISMKVTLSPICVDLADVC